MTQFFKDHKNNLSSMRLVLVIVVLVVFTVWAVISFVKGEVQPFPMELAGLIGALAVGKAVQKNYENELP